MSREQNTKSELKSKRNEDDSASAQSSKKSKSNMSFDLYFLKMQAKNPSILAHHKAAMKQYAEQKGLIEAEEREFDEIFRVY